MGAANAAPNPARTHLRVLTANGTERALCQSWGAQRFTDLAYRVTCGNCRSAINARLGVVFG